MLGEDPTTPEDLQRSYLQAMEAAGRPVTEAEKLDEPPQVERIVEALLFVGGDPLSAERVLAIIRGFSADQFDACVADLNRRYRAQNRPYLVRSGPGGYVLAVKPKYAELREQLYGGLREARLSTAAVDVLALVAYQQPTTKAEIERFRGADSGTLLKLLVRRGLVKLQGEGEVARYVTTSRFLETIGIRSLEDLPRTQDLELL